MDKQKQIEEMAQCKNLNGYTCKSCGVKNACDRYILAEELYNAGYHKIPEGAVVLTTEEYDYITFANKFIKEEMQSIKAQARKETAEKFAKRLKANLLASYAFDDDCTIEELEFDGATIQRCIDQILKEITENGK